MAEAEVVRVTSHELIALLRSRIHTVLDPIIPTGSSCALLDFPDHWNVGDSAIWLGQRSFLQRKNVSVVHTCDRVNLFQRPLAKSLDARSLILLHGGGNLGDLWPAHQMFRERVIAAFPQLPIIQFPQTIHFREKTNLARARSIFNAHPRLTILVRDQRSLEFARNEFSATSLLCPDMAFALGPLRRAEPARTHIVWLSRTDLRVAQAEQAGNGTNVTPVDWPTEDGRFRRLRLPLRRRVIRYATQFAPTSRRLVHLFDALAFSRLSRGLRLLSTGRVVVTNRLHGHILSLLMDIPHVIVDNGYGKILTHYNTWTKPSDMTWLGHSWSEALTIAMAVAGREAR